MKAQFKCTDGVIVPILKELGLFAIKRDETIIGKNNISNKLPSDLLEDYRELSLDPPQIESSPDSNENLEGTLLKSPLQSGKISKEQEDIQLHWVLDESKKEGTKLRNESSEDDESDAAMQYSTDENSSDIEEEESSSEYEFSP